MHYHYLIQQVLASKDSNVVEEVEDFTFILTYSEPTFLMLKSLSVVGDQDEDSRATNSILKRAMINFKFQTIHSTLRCLNAQR